MKAFRIKVKIYAPRIGLEADRVIDVDDDRKLDEIMDVPIGQLILGSAYKQNVSDDNVPTVELYP